MLADGLTHITEESSVHRSSFISNISVTWHDFNVSYIWTIHMVLAKNTENILTTCMLAQHHNFSYFLGKPTLGNNQFLP